MAHLRLRSQFLIATLPIICSLLGALLLILRHTVRSEIVEQVRQSTSASLHAFENVRQEREVQLARTAAMLAELPTLKAVMTTQHPLTIQDASERFWKLAGSPLFVLANPEGQVYGFHVAKPGWDAQTAQRDLKKSLERGVDAAWWYGQNQLYRVFLRPLKSGSGLDERQLGIIAVGYEVDSAVASQLARASGGEIALTADGRIIASTLSAEKSAELQQRIYRQEDFGEKSRDISLSDKRYQAAAVSLYTGPEADVKCYVLKSLDAENAFLQRLNRTILILGISAIMVAALLLTFMSRTITHPLDDLVAGVRALAQGDYSYSINPRGSSEVAELGETFAKMRGELLASEQRRFEAERIIALGRAASSISHDLRHYLATMVANAEFLYEAEKLNLNRDEIYGEIRTASEQMTDLLDSMRELSREQGTISPQLAELDRIIRRAVEAVRARPEMRSRTISIRAQGETTGMFDPQKIERAFINLILNACEASAQTSAEIAIDIRPALDWLEIRVTDHGTGVPAAIRGSLFDPFVSYGKANGTGLGLAIVNRVIQEHGGSVTLEHTSNSGTTFLVQLPRAPRLIRGEEQRVSPQRN